MLDTVHESYDYIEPTPSIILQLHRNLCRHTDSAFGGAWKDSDNTIVEFDSQGNKRVRFKPLPAVATLGVVEELCAAYKDALATGTYDPLLLICVFTFDFICMAVTTLARRRLTPVPWYVCHRA